MGTQDTKTILQNKGNRFFIKINNGPQGGKIYNLTANEATLGRGPNNDILIADPNLSRSHIVFTTKGAHCVVRDLNSRNGVYVNSKKVSRRELKHQDLIQVGDTEIVFIEIEKDIDLQPEVLSDNSPNAKQPPAAPIDIGPENPSQVFALNIDGLDSGGILGLFGKLSKPARLFLVAMCIIIAFIGFVVLNARRNHSSKTAKTKPSGKKTLFQSEKSHADKNGSAVTVKAKPLNLIGSQEDIFHQCLDFEDLGLIRKAIACYRSIKTRQGANDALDRNLALQERLSKKYYTEGQDMFEAGYYQRALERWTLVLDIAKHGGEYFKSAQKGIRHMKKKRMVKR